MEQNSKNAAGALAQSEVLTVALGLFLLLAVDWCGDFAIPAGNRDFASQASGNLLSSLAPAALKVAVLVAAALKPERFERWFERRGIPVTCGLVAALAFVSSRFTTAAILPEALLVALSEVSSSLLFLSWLARCCRLSPRKTQLALPLAFLLMAMGYFVLLGINIPWVALVLLTLCPLLSALLLEIWHPARDEQEEIADRPATWSFPFLPVALLVLYKLIFYFSLSLTDGPSLFGPLGIIVIALIALVGTLFFFQSFTPTLLYRLSLPFMVAGLLLLAWLHTGSVAATMLTNASNIGFELFIFLALAQVCFRYDIDGVWMFSIVLAASSVATALGRLAGAAFIQSFPAGSPEANLTVALVVVGLVALSVLFVNDRIVSRTFGTEPNRHATAEESAHATMSYYEELVWRCQRIARNYGLTHREEEVLELLVQGFSNARIEESLVISRSTTKTHIRHLYEKLGVHSREEARAIVESA